MSDLIKVSEEFHFNGKGLWLGLERTSNPSEGLVSQYVKAHEDLVSAFKAISGQTMTDYNSGQPSWNRHEEPTPSAPPVIDRAYERAKETVEKLIDDAQNKSDLSRHWDKAVEYGLKDHYENRLNELS